MLDQFLNMNHNEVLFGVFAIVIILFLIFDLGFFNKEPHKVSFKSALYQSVFWVVISILFGLGIYFYGNGKQEALEFFSAYVTEYALSVDNIFVILLILTYFKVDEIYYHRILFWGVLGAIAFRGIFILLGAYLIGQFYWILYIFGAFLVYTGVKIFFVDDEDDYQPENNPLIRLARKYLRVTKGNYRGKFVLYRGGKLFFTPLFLVIILVETTDLIFAVDSIPAVFAISQNEFVLYTSNIFAILGLRAKFFLLTGILDRFYLLHKGLAFILVFIGAKMLLEIVNLHIPIGISFISIFTILFLSILLSLIFPQKESDVKLKSVVEDDIFGDE